MITRISAKPATAAMPIATAGLLRTKSRGVVDHVVDALVADRAGEAGDGVGGAMGIVAIILAEPLVDRLGGVVDHFAEIVEQAGGAALAVVGEAADPVARLAAQARRPGRGPGSTSRSVPASAVGRGDEAAAVAFGGGAADDMIGAFGQVRDRDGA